MAAKRKITIPAGNGDTVLCGDCYTAITEYVWDASVDLIMTSPPYAEKRKKTYGGIPVNQYVDWFLQRAAVFKRVLKDTGSFVLNIKEGVVDGERETYVMDLIKALRDLGFRWVDTYCWSKANCFPGYWPNRLRDAWEPCYHFVKQKKFAMYQDAVKVPIGDWADKRLKNLSETDKRRDESKVRSGFGKKIANWVGKELVLPSNVLSLPTECGNKNHSAAFPVDLPEFFIKLFTKPGDSVLDPFVGSGTTCVAAKRLGRQWLGIDIERDNVIEARKRLAKTQYASALTK